MPELSEAAIRQLIGQKLSEIEIQQLLSLIATGQATLATGDRAVSVGGSANDAVLITGDRNILILIHQADVSTLQMLKDFLAQYANSEQVTAIASVDELVQQVRSRIYDDIQQLHGTMPLWGVDHWVPLGELFVDVNILEELSSNHRSELEDLWQDFQQNPTYRSLDRIGLGRNRERVSGLAVLEKNTNLMVVGKPGSGKTTYLQRVVTECNIGNLQTSKIPVLIKLREFVEDGRSLSYSLDRYLEQYWQLTEAETRLILRQGRSLVLLDGLDEITGEEGKTITKQIKQFARACPHVQIIMTCRTQSFSGEMDWKSLRFSFVEVADFNEAQVRSFAEHWFKTVIQDRAIGLAKLQEFLDQLFLEENKPIQNLVVTPILLSLTCAVFRQAGKFYSKRSKLYEKSLELLLEQWDRSREIERDEIYRGLSIERKLELLSHLAVKKFEQEQYVLFEQTEIEKYIAEFLEIGRRESQAVLKAIESQHGLLIERSQSVWSFSHLTFQEYLVAKLFCKRTNWRELLPHIIKRHWREIILLIVEVSENRDEVLLLIKDFIDCMLIGEDKVQIFLKWIKDKSCLIEAANPSFKAVEVRAIYIGYLPSVELLSQQVGGRSFRSSLAIKLNSALQETMNRFTRNSINFMQNNAHNTLLDTLNSTISGDYSRPYSAADINFINMFVPDIEDILTGLEKDLSDLKEQLLSEKTQERLFINFSNIAGLLNFFIYPDFKFEVDQIEILNHYYYTNELVVDCLNIDAPLSAQTRVGIIEKLFLPIAEIAKRKREQVE